jgi:hypothetical protein
LPRHAPWTVCSDGRGGRLSLRHKPTTAARQRPRARERLTAGCGNGVHGHSMPSRSGGRTSVAAEWMASAGGGGPPRHPPRAFRPDGRGGRLHHVHKPTNGDRQHPGTSERLKAATANQQWRRRRPTWTPSLPRA